MLNLKLTTTQKVKRKDVTEKTNNDADTNQKVNDIQTKDDKSTHQ